MPNELENLQSKLPPGSIWEGWKSTPEERKLYLIEGFSRDTTTRDLRVHYFPLYQNEFGNELPWSRTVDEFLSEPKPGITRYKRIV